MASIKFDRVFILALVLFAGVCTAQYDEDDTELTEAHLIARKTIAEKVSVSGENATVTIQIFNAGSSAAHGVSLKDTTFPSTYYDLVEGAFSAAWAKIGAGSNVSHTFVVKPKNAGMMMSGPAVVTYRPSDDSDEEQAMLSTSIIGRPVLSMVQKYVSLALQLGRYISLGVLKTQGDWTVFGGVGAVLFILFGTNSSILRYNEWRKERMSKSATDELLKDE
mmetsp:Transcript_7676/g.15622  ORF Transcript_7676/g.15622 Transcript_7676/m.15622 type:complete len:221 (-) Transcript_7676:563-1225(-)